MAALVAPHAPRARFLVVGDGAPRSALEAQAGRPGVADRVTFAGARDDVWRLLRAFDVFVMPSLSEGGPYTVAEAMARTPTVATPVGFVPELICDGEQGLSFRLRTLVPWPMPC